LVRHGRSVELPDAGGFDQAVRLTADGELVAIAERRDGGLKPVTVLNPA
jgi:hypothetical protein